MAVRSGEPPRTVPSNGSNPFTYVPPVWPLPGGALPEGHPLPFSETPPDDGNGETATGEFPWLLILGAAGIGLGAYLLLRK